MSHPTTPTFAPSSTVAELELRLRDLETRFLGPISDHGTHVSNLFALVSSIHQRLQHFQQTGERRNSEKSVLSKLPAVQLPTFDGTDLGSFLKNWERWLRLSGVCDSRDKFKLDWLIEACSPKVRKLVEKLVDESPDELLDVLQKMETLFPKLENDITLRSNLEKIPQLPQSPEPSSVAQLFVEFEEILARLTPNALSEQEKFLMLVKKLHPKSFAELRADRYYKQRTQEVSHLKAAII